MNNPSSTVCLDVPVLAVVGPTASGKTARAVALARRLGAEIISGDSRQVYRGMTLGTGKDLEEYGDVPYHLIDIADAGTKYNLYGFLRDASDAYGDICRRGRVPLLCGGTGMYVEAFLKGTALPEVPQNDSLRQSLRGKTLEELTGMLSRMKTLHNITDVDTPKRAIRAIEIQTYYAEHPEESRLVDAPTPRPALVVGIDVPRDVRRSRITSRLHARLDAGMADEVRALLASGVRSYVLRSGIQICHSVCCRRYFGTGNVLFARNGHSSVRQTADDVVSGHGAPRNSNPLASL